MLIAADLFRSIWLFVFPVVAFALDSVKSQTGFCQVSGYLTQMSFEMTDMATLLIATHTALQVFRARPSAHGQGGLHRYRHLVYPLYFIIPASLAALAFINGRFAYLSQGPLCSLPIRPFWYRLIMSWIPRYVIILMIIALYAAIYIHAEHQFSDSRIFRGKLASAMRRLSDSRRKSRAQPQLQNLGQLRTDANLRDIQYPGGNKAPGSRESHGPGASQDQTANEDQQQASSSLIVFDFESTRHTSSATAGTNRHLLNSSNTTDPSGSNANWQPNQLTQPPTSHQVGDSSRQGSYPTQSSGSSGAVQSSRRNSYPEQNYSLIASDIDTQFEIEAMHKKRNAIRRQLRLLFVYPLVYFLDWVGPFVLHGTLYNSHIAAHPSFGLSLWSYASFAILGFVDAIIFSVREKPWRHIPGADGTILGSFRFWQRDPNVRARAYSRDSTQTASRKNSSPQISPSRRRSSIRRDEEAQAPVEQLVKTLSREASDQEQEPTHPDAGLQAMISWDFRKSKDDNNQTTGSKR